MSRANELFLVIGQLEEKQLFESELAIHNPSEFEEDMIMNISKGSKDCRIQNGKNTAAGRTKPGKKGFSVLLAACMVLAMGIITYATNPFGLRDLSKTQSYELSDKAADYIQEQTGSAELENWSCKVSESLCDSANVMATVTIFGGDRYIVAPTDASLTDRINVIGLTGTQTLEEYAASKGKTLLLVGATLKDADTGTAGVGSQRMENISESEMVIFTSSTGSWIGTAKNIVCEVYAREAGTVDVQRVTLPLVWAPAPTWNADTYYPLNPDAVDGIKVGEASVEETPLGYDIRFPVYNYNHMTNVGKIEIENLANDAGSLVMEDDGIWYFHTSMATGKLEGILTVCFYDLDKIEIGKIEFRQVLSQ